MLLHVKSINNSTYCRDVAQSVEPLAGGKRVAGSTPAIPVFIDLVGPAGSLTENGCQVGFS